MSKQRIFDNIEHLKHECNLIVEIPKYIPKDCNVIRYDLVTGSPFFHKEEEDGFLYYFTSDKTWCSGGSDTLEEEVERDVRNGYKSAYLRLATKDISDVFTPERLLGVETTEGFITSVFNSWLTGRLFITATNCRNLVVSEVEYYISDDSDETISFAEYVNKFYDGGVCGNKQGKVSCL